MKKFTQYVKEKEQKESKINNKQIQNVKHIASECLSICGIPANLKRLIEYYNLRTLSIDMPLCVSGLVMPDPYQSRFVLVVNNRMNYYHRRFTIAHEMYHVICRSEETVFNVGLFYDKSEERQANIFAKELLMPESAVRKIYEDGCRKIKEYCDFFRVSKAAMRIRLFKELNYPDRDFSAF